MQPATRRRYDAAVDKCLVFLKNNNLTLPRQKQLVDPLACEYLEHLWCTGAGRALASDTSAGLQDAQPLLRGQLPGAWRLMKTWTVNEIPSRAPPEHVLLSMVGWAFFKGYVTFGISLLISFYGMLRSGEVIGLMASRVVLSAEQSQLLICSRPDQGR